MLNLNASPIQKEIKSRKAFVSLGIGLISGAAFITSVGICVPASAMTIVIDSFQNPTSPSPLTVSGAGTTSSTQTISTGLSATTNRQATLTTTSQGAAQDSTLAIGTGTFSTTPGSGSNRTATSTLDYSGFGNFNFIAAGTSEFNFTFSRTGNATITVTLEATGPGGTATFTTTTPTAPSLSFAFSSFTNSNVFNNVTALRILVGTSNSSTATLGSIRAVPVLPAFLGTLLVVGIVAAKSLERKSALISKSTEE